MAARKRLFEAVFPPPTQKSLPTPTATPVIPQGSFGGSSFGDPAHSQEDSVTEDIKFERAWHHATELLSIRNAPLTSEDASKDVGAIQDKWIKRPSRTASDAIAYVISCQSRSGSKGDDLLHWYTQEVGRHYLDHQLPVLINLLSSEQGSESLHTLLRILSSVNYAYRYPFELHVIAKLPVNQARIELERFKDSLHAMIRVSLSKTNYRQLSQELLTEWTSLVFDVQGKEEEAEGDAMDQDDDEGKDVSPISPDDAHSKISNLLLQMDEAGLGGSEAQRGLAEVMHELMTTYANRNYAGQWTAPSEAPKELQDWVQGDFANFVVENLSCLSGARQEDKLPVAKITHEDVSNWQQRIVGDLGMLRIKELFDVVVDWENDSQGAIEDLKQYTTSTNSRAYLVLYFAQVISQRLLHPGASTTQILQTYIFIIRAFAVLDPRGVLLDRLARPIRRYLRDRDDTVRIIVTGLLADPDSDSSSNPETLIELALELNRIVDDPTNDDSLADLDFDDLNWSPDPVDAGPEYRKTKSTDVISTLTSLFESKEVFVREFQSILSTRLLDPSCSLEKEERVLELLKLRFGEGSLQACEVMMRDVVDSVRTDAWIKREQNMNMDPQAPPGIQMSAKILSRLYWPPLDEESFRLPPELQKLQDSYSEGFIRYKSTRKLTFLDALGTVDVELELEDRTIREIVPAAYASVIYTFQDSSASGEPISKTTSQLEGELEIDADLLATALDFWVQKVVLSKSPIPHLSTSTSQPESEHTYTVLETLPRQTPTSSSQPHHQSPSRHQPAPQVVPQPTKPLKTEEDLLDERLQPFWPFIVGMLTNQGAMQPGRIALMLNMAVPGGFPHGESELRGFLVRKVEGGSLEAGSGGKFGVKRS